MSALASVVIPAHNEERVITSTLRSLQRGLAADELDVVVVCNGCTDRTADNVREGFPQARVLEIGRPSKAAAVAAGNSVSPPWPDSKLELSRTSTAGPENSTSWKSPFAFNVSLSTAPPATIRWTDVSGLQ